MARLLERWFGVRELSLAALPLRGHGGPGRSRAAKVSRRRREREFAALNAANKLVGEGTRGRASLGLAEQRTRGASVTVPEDMKGEALIVPAASSPSGVR